MKKLTAVLIVITLFSACHSPQESFQVSGGILFENITVITTGEFGAIERLEGYILTENDKIIYVGKDRPGITGMFETVDGK
uniref:hypothetical protein n=1 Tax=Fulvivirga sp. TaxID=1931237 RepID=UPI004048FF31